MLELETRNTVLARVVVIATGLVLVSCGDESPTGPDYDPSLPAAWADAVTNPFFPLVPGTIYTYQGQTEDEIETIIVEVLDESRVVNEVRATVVRDRVYVDDELVEDTHDWFAQDADGNVWYLGESVKNYEDGEPVDTEGSFEWGVDGALPGIIMWADPILHLGQEYRQEFYEGEAEDWGKVVAVSESVSAPYGAFTDCIRTEDWDALEPGTLENKWFCRQVGLVREMAVQGEEEVVELMEVTSR